MVHYHGSWKISVVRKDSDWPQRLVFTGSMHWLYRAEVGTTITTPGGSWDVSIEFNPGTGWQPSAAVLPGPVRKKGMQVSQLVMSKDRYWAGDADPNDLVLRMESVGAGFEAVAEAFAADPGSLAPLGDGALTGSHGAQLLGVEIRNTSHEAFDYDTVLDISDQGRAALESCGVLVRESWTAAVLRVTGQEAFGRATGVPPLKVGERATVYFPVDATGSRRGTPEAELVLSSVEGSVGAHHAACVVRVADATPGTAPPTRPGTAAEPHGAGYHGAEHQADQDGVPVPGDQIVRVARTGAAAAVHPAPATVSAEPGTAGVEVETRDGSVQIRPDHCPGLLP